MTLENSPSHWDEEASRIYLDYGKYFIPDRQQQMHIMVQLLGGLPPPMRVLELCCGEGLLAEQILLVYPDIHYLGLDGSPLMLEKAGTNLGRFGERADLSSFELADPSWRTLTTPVQAVVSSLAIHHLDGKGKQNLFFDVFKMLTTGGVFIIADMVEPASQPGRMVAANAWDEQVRQRCIELDGNTAGLDFFLREHWNTYRFPDPEDIDHPSSLNDQLKWLDQASFDHIDVHFFRAGHAIFSGWKSSNH